MRQPANTGEEERLVLGSRQLAEGRVKGKAQSDLAGLLLRGARLGRSARSDLTCGPLARQRLHAHTTHGFSPCTA